MARIKKIAVHELEFYKTKWRKEWRWRIIANNGKVIAASSEGYKNKQDCIYNAKSTSKSINVSFRNYAKEKRAQNEQNNQKE